MTTTLRIAVVPKHELTGSQHTDIVALCSRAYDEDFAPYLAPFPQATHVLGMVDGQIVSHAMWVERTLDYAGTPLRTAYVEAVATDPVHQGRGFASALMNTLANAIVGYDLGVLSPSDQAFYARLGWEPWRGPLSVATAHGVVPTPDEEVMILRLPGTPPLDLDQPLTAPWREGEVW